MLLLLRLVVALQTTSITTAVVIVVIILVAILALHITLVLKHQPMEVVHNTRHRQRDAQYTCEGTEETHNFAWKGFRCHITITNCCHSNHTIPETMRYTRELRVLYVSFGKVHKCAEQNRGEADKYEEE